MPLLVLGVLLWLLLRWQTPSGSLREVLHCPSLALDPHGFAGASHPLKVPGLHHPHAMLWSCRHLASLPAYV